MNFMDFIYYLKQPFIFLKDCFTMIVHPNSTIERIKNRKISVKFLFLSLILICLIRLPIQYYYWKIVNLNENLFFIKWDLINFLGYYFQSLIFLFFFYILGVLTIDIITKYVFKGVLQFKLLSKLFLFILIIYSLSELVSLLFISLQIPSYFEILSIFKAPSHFNIFNLNLTPSYFKVEMGSVWIIVTVGQIFQGLFLAVFAFIYIYNIQKSKIQAFINVLILTTLFSIIYFLLFPLVNPMISELFKVVYWGSMNEASYIIVWIGEIIFFLMFIPVFYFIYLSVYKKQVKKQLLWIKPIRTFHYIYMVIIGFFLGLKCVTLFELVCLIISIFAAWNCAGLVNDYFDTTADQYANVERPFVGGLMDKWDLSMLIFWLYIISISFSLFISFSAFIIILIFHISSIAYSVPPIRFKRYPLATVFIGVVTFLSLLLGATPTTFRTQQFLFKIPIEFASLTVVLVALIPSIIVIFLSTIKDLKDIEGDAADGVKTFVLYVGPERAILIIQIFAVVCYGCLAFILPFLKYPVWTIIFPIVSIIVTIVSLNKFKKEMSPKTAKKMIGIDMMVFFLALIGFLF